ncbi:hypothetical protein DFH28DRAFT_309830 [Melampsora americana]|nr:hypothetical protein DFH28DRAFT_309830 [Melampsora americana]
MFNLFWILIIFFNFSISIIITQTDHLSKNSTTDYACRPIGSCEPCPKEELTNSICEIFGNRRMMNCLYLASSSPALILSILNQPKTYSSELIIKFKQKQKNRRNSIHQNQNQHQSILSKLFKRLISSGYSDDQEEQLSTDLNQNQTLNQIEDHHHDRVEMDLKHQASIGTSSSAGGAEFPTWEACERVVSKERADFYEFLFCNLFLTILSLVIYILRTRLLINRQYNKLIKRIGLGSNLSIIS